MPSTGRRPALSPSGVEALLTRYFAEDKPSLAQLATEFAVTNADGASRNLSLATIRKYLSEAGISLPRGRAAAKPRPSVSIRSMMNRIPTATLIGEGRERLLMRRIEAGESMTSLAKEFGVSRDRVARLRGPVASSAPAAEDEAASDEAPACEV
jgi:hypothetical protein